MNTLPELLLACVPSVLGGAVLYFVRRALERMEQRTERRENNERRRTVLMLKNLNAIGGITEKIAVCVKNERVNGDLEERMLAYREQKLALEDFLREQAVQS